MFYIGGGSRGQGGGGDVCPHKNCLVGTMPPQKFAAVTDGYVSLSLCSKGQCGTVA